MAQIGALLKGLLTEMWAGPKKPEASSIGELLLCLGIRGGRGGNRLPEPSEN